MGESDASVITIRRRHWNSEVLPEIVLFSIVKSRIIRYAAATANARVFPEMVLFDNGERVVIRYAATVTARIA